MGYRGRGSGRIYPGNGPFRDLPPWQRPGGVYGAGRGYASGDPYACQRFPWLPRGWWADPNSQSVYLPQAPTPENERQFIESQITAAESHVKALKKRLDSLKVNEGTLKGEGG